MPAGEKLWGSHVVGDAACDPVRATGKLRRHGLSMTKAGLIAGELNQWVCPSGDVHCVPFGGVNVHYARLEHVVIGRPGEQRV
jgi:hypothetical protein